MRITFYLFFAIFISTIDLFAQNTNDCIVYKNVLLYLNKKEAWPKIVYGGIIDPESDDVGTPVQLNELHQYSFYIVSKKTDFDYLSIRNWFSSLIKDSSIIQKKYIFDNDSIINCIFDNNIKYQYKPFTEIRFSEKDFLQEKQAEKNIFYSPMRITFSKVLYTNDDRALVYVKFYLGNGSGRDIGVYGFVFNKNNSDWELKNVEIELR